MEECMKKFCLTVLIAAGILFCSSDASVLSTTAAGMQPGTWAQVTVSNQNAVLGVGDHSGTMIAYCNSMPWNPKSKVIEIIGMDHGYPQLRLANYVESSNQFTLVADNAGLGPAHGYDHNSLNPATGDLYHSMYGAGPNPVTIKCKSYGSSSYTTLTSEYVGVEYTGVAIGTCWWSGRLIGGGAQGTLMLYAGGSAGSGRNGAVRGYNPVTNSWFFTKLDASPTGATANTYHHVFEYSAKKNVAVYGGGNGQGSLLWRLDSNGNTTLMPVVPSGVDNVGAGEQMAKFVDDPASGNFLLIGNNQLWELNPDGAGAWTQKATPPAGVGDPMINQYLIPVSIPDYGVVAFITQPGHSNGTFFLYKNDSNGSVAEVGNKNVETLKLSVQPSPSSVTGLVRISSGRPGARYTVYNVEGKIVADLGNKTVWSPRGIKAGVYMVKAQIGNRIVSQRLVLE
jgi:hypothetical protein